jgi:large subunit ribosomal protein L17
MPHQIFGTKLSRDTGQRQALLKGLAGAMIRSESIETTVAKAEAAKILIEKLVTQAKRATVSDIRNIEAVIVNKDLVYKLVHDIAPRYKTRPGGYLRLVKLGSRTGDNAPMVKMEFVSAPAPASPVAAPKKTTVKAKSTPAKALAPKASKPSSKKS